MRRSGRRIASISWLLSCSLLELDRMHHAVGVKNSYKVKQIETHMQSERNIREASRNKRRRRCARKAPFKIQNESLVQQQTTVIISMSTSNVAD